ncbi:P-loop containing nucleoside triphosphate hydrolase protein [Dactylonectria estremocensis]|uniref:P-loop containing nucleoside triphosphate hydrolase protein n=1 Tax=Dactylonectria estremocensis TaxID=1079267 RepID=A0A9P9CXQ1_9HYPO|nr:P-loop containing nucleoside triphosphate hydrolase protein [Dactylonectria estremocensis]
MQAFIFINDRLDGLCSQEKLHLLDAVDSLRSHGISRYISLPQIIVCGDQSSGKSSVLEAISGVPFPVRSNVCTRFPMELVLRKTAHEAVNVSIVPHSSRTKPEKAALAKFKEKLETFDELPNLIDRATAAMGITAIGKAFSNDLLRIEINGPDRPHLTIVDLPGLIHSETKNQSAADVRMIKDVVRGYMKEPRSIILAVVSAKNDYANQVVLKLARSADRKGNRTLGIITKPDTLLPASQSERSFLSLASNKDVEFRLGWHVLKNTDSEAGIWTLEERNALEAEFLSSGSWTAIEPSNRGIEALRTRLSKLLVQQIALELPNLISDIVTRTALCQTRLEKLGEARTTINQQRIYLIKISQGFQSIVRAAIDGTYNDRIRAVIQNLNVDFAAKLGKDGKHLELHDSESEVPDARPGLTREQFLDKIIKLMKRSRGKELPGMFNPMIVTDLFREQSSPWEDITRAHVKAVWAATQDFLRHVIHEIADVTTVATIWEKVVMPKLDDLLLTLMERTTILVKQHQQSHPVTYNQDLTDEVQKARVERSTQMITRKVEKFFHASQMQAHYCGATHNLELLVQQLALDVEPDPSRIAASGALEYLEAYYMVAMKRFIDDVSAEVIETGLVSELGSIIEPVGVSAMSAEELNGVAGETGEARRGRQELQTQLSVLKSGAEICKRFAGFGMLDFDDDPPSDTDAALDTEGNESNSEDMPPDDTPPPAEEPDGSPEEKTDMALPEPEPYEYTDKNEDVPEVSICRILKRNHRFSLDVDADSL